MNIPNLHQLNYLPYCYAKHASIQHAITFKLCTESLLSVPRSVVIDGIISYGGSTGIGLDLPRKAYGEFFERNHLFTAIPIHCQKPLTSVHPPQFREKLLALCHFDHMDKEACLNHLFSFTMVNNLFDHSDQDYFFNAICLHGSKADSHYLSFSDSCGCASHPDKKKSLYNSLMEFLERQALLGSWLSQTCHYAIHPAVLKKVTPYANLTEKLLENGDLYIFENGLGLPGYTVIMFYFSQAENDLVQYAIGSSSGLSLSEALTSSLEELYQCYTFLYNTECSSGLENKVGSGYHLSFQQCNHQKVKSTIPFIQQAVPLQIKTADDVLSLKKFTYDEIIAELADISTDIFYYHSYKKEVNLHFTKIMSPDFFAHMSLNKPLNIDNAYAKKLKVTKENAYLEKIPFP